MYMYVRYRVGCVKAAKGKGVLHESYAHECLKSSLAFRKPAVAVASRRPARADGPNGQRPRSASMAHAMKERYGAVRIW